MRSAEARSGLEGRLDSAVGLMEGAEEILRQCLERTVGAGDAQAERKIREILWHLAVAKIRARQFSEWLGRDS